MVFSQKAFLFNRAHFIFGETALDVVIDDGRLTVGFSAPYPDIGTRRSIKSFPERAFMRLAVALLGALLAAYALMQGELPPESIPVFISLVALVLGLCVISQFARFDATRIPVVSGNTILVFHDRNHAAILDEIYRRRKGELRRQHMEIDLLSNPQLELKKLLWLKEEGAITEQELEQARQKVEAVFHPKRKV